MKEDSKVKKLDRTLIDSIAGIVTFVVFLFFFVFSFPIAEKNISGAVSSRTLPQFVSILGMVVSIILTLKSLIEYQKTKKTKSVIFVPRKRWKAMACSFGLFLGYIALMELFGFIVMSILYLTLQMLLLTAKEERTIKKIITILIISIMVTIIAYLPFRYLFKLMIPSGIIFK